MRYLSLSLLLLLFVPLMAPAFGADWYDSNWLKARKITIDQTDIDTADLTNYPLYVNMTLVNVGTDSQADCDDFVFVDSTNVTKLDHEIETCDDANNWAEFWVEVPTVDFDADTIIFMYYDNAGASDQQNTPATWNSNFQLVGHLNATFIDSTSSPITCTNSGSSAVTDEYIGDSRSFDLVNDYINCGSNSKTDNIFDGGGTISAWVLANSGGEGSLGMIMNKYQSATNGWYVSTTGATTPTPLRFVSYVGASPPTWTTNANWLPTNKWIFVSVTFNDDASTNNPLIYVNGTSRALTQTNPDAAYVSDAAEAICIGNNNPG